MYKEYLAEFWYSANALENSKVSFSVPTGGIYGEVGVNTFRNAIGAHYLAHSSEYVTPPSIDIVRPWFKTIGYGEIVPVKGTLKKSLLSPRWRLLMAQIIQYLGGKTGGFDQITNKDSIILYSLANGINIDYASIFWEDIIIKLNKRHREKVVLYTRLLSLLMIHKMKEGDGDEQLSQWHLKLPNLLPMLRGFPKAQRQELNLDTRSNQLLQNNHLCLVKRQEKDQQATGGPTSLGVTSEERANPQLSSGMLTFNLNKPIYSASFIIQSEFASANDASAVSTAEADLGNFAPSTDPHVLADQTKSGSEGLETVLTEPITGKGANSVARLIEEETSSTIKLEDLAKLMSHVQPSFKHLDSPKDDHLIVVDDNVKDKDDEVHSTENVETKDTSVPKSSSPRSTLLSQYGITHRAASKVLKNEFLNIISAHDFSISLPTDLKDLPSKLNELTGEVKGLKKQVHELEIELPGDLKEIPTKLDDFTKNVTSLTSQVAELKTLQWELPTEFLSLPAQVASVQAKLKTLDALPGLLLNTAPSTPSTGQHLTPPSTGQNHPHHPTRHRHSPVLLPGHSSPYPNPTEASNTKRYITNPPTPVPDPLQLSLDIPTKTTRTHQKHSAEQTPQSTTNTQHGDSSHQTKKLTKFDFITEDGRHIYLTEEQIYYPKKLEEDAKAEAAKQEGEVRKAKLFDLLGPEVVKKYYNDKLPYDRYCDKMLNRRDGTNEIISNFKDSDMHLDEWREVMKACPNRTGKGWETIYKQIGTRMDYIHTTEVELGINLDIPLSKQDPLDKLNDLTNKKRKHADDIHDYFKVNKSLKSLV
ncbi:hypothetical protein Tco_0731843 [Tanacetum coccineum]